MPRSSWRDSLGLPLEMADWTFEPMTRVSARAIAAWRYEGRHSFYNADADPDDLAALLDESRWQAGDLHPDREVVQAVRLGEGQLAGFFSFQGSPNLCTIGLGLAPELVGRGLGAGFVSAGLRFAVSQWGTRHFRLEVAAFNRRAIKVYSRLGFREIARAARSAPELDGASVEFVAMSVSVEELDVGPAQRRRGPEQDR